MVKPFHYPELLARIRAVLRRRSAEREGPRRVGELTVDAATREVRVGERSVELANKEFERIPLLKPDSGVGGNGLATRQEEVPSAAPVASTVEPWRRNGARGSGSWAKADGGF